MTTFDEDIQIDSQVDFETSPVRRRRYPTSDEPIDAPKLPNELRGRLSAHAVAELEAEPGAYGVSPPMQGYRVCRALYFDGLARDEIVSLVLTYHQPTLDRMREYRGVDVDIESTVDHIAADMAAVETGVVRAVGWVLAHPYPLKTHPMTLVDTARLAKVVAETGAQLLRHHGATYTTSYLAHAVDITYEAAAEAVDRHVEAGAIEEHERHDPGTDEPVHRLINRDTRRPVMGWPLADGWCVMTGEPGDRCRNCLLGIRAAADDVFLPDGLGEIGWLVQLLLRHGPGTATNLVSYTYLHAHVLERGLRRLERQDFVMEEEGRWYFTETFLRVHGKRLGIDVEDTWFRP